MTHMIISYMSNIVIKIIYLYLKTLKTFKKIDNFNIFICYLLPLKLL